MRAYRDFDSRWGSVEGGSPGCSAARWSCRCPAGPIDSIVVPVRTVPNRKGSPGLERCDAGNRPTAQGIFPPARPRSRNRPQVSDSQPVRAIEIAQSAIELQPSLGYRYRCTVLLVWLLGAQITGAFTCAVDELGPRI